MDIVGYDNIEDIQLQLSNPTGDDSSNSSVPGISSPKIDANTSVKNIPESGGGGSSDIVGRSTGIVWTATDYNTVAWTSGDIILGDGTTYSINAGNTGNISAINYIYADIATPSATLLKTTTPQDAVGAGKLMVAVCKPVTDTAGKAIVQPFGTVGTDVFITADNIAANTITANQLAANSIDGMTITGATIRTASSGQRVQMNGSNNRLEFRDSDGDSAGYITGIDNASIGPTIATSNNMYVGGTMLINGKLRIPVGSNLY